MPVIISDEILREAHLTERDATVEFACRLFDAQKIGKGLASKMVGMTRDDFNEELIKRGLPVIRYTEDMFKEDVETIDHLQHVRNGNDDDRRK